MSLCGVKSEVCFAHFYLLTRLKHFILPSFYALCVHMCVCARECVCGCLDIACLCSSSVLLRAWAATPCREAAAGFGKAWQNIPSSQRALPSIFYSCRGYQGILFTDTALNGSTLVQGIPLLQECWCYN